MVQGNGWSLRDEVRRAWRSGGGVGHAFLLFPRAPLAGAAGSSDALTALAEQRLAHSAPATKAEMLLVRTANDSPLNHDSCARTAASRHIRSTTLDRLCFTVFAMPISLSRPHHSRVRGQRTSFTVPSAHTSQDFHRSRLALSFGIRPL